MGKIPLAVSCAIVILLVAAGCRQAGSGTVTTPSSSIPARVPVVENQQNEDVELFVTVVLNATPKTVNITTVPARATKELPAVQFRLLQEGAVYAIEVHDRSGKVIFSKELGLDALIKVDWRITIPGD